MVFRFFLQFARVQKDGDCQEDVQPPERKRMLIGITVSTDFGRGCM